MKKTLVTMLIVAAAGYVFAQDPTVKGLKEAAGKEIKKDPNDTIPKLWKLGGLVNANLNQAALSNWAAGGDKSSLSLNSLLSLYAYYTKGKHSWNNTLDLAYGIVSTTSLGNRKADDRIDFLSKYGYRISPKNWYVTGLFNFRTQFAKGFSYPDNNSKILTSDFMAPAYILVSPGISYQPSDNFSIFLSPITARWTIVSNDSLSAAGAYGVDPGKKTKLEMGAFASVNYKKKISESASYQGRLDLFSNYRHKPANIDLYMTNILLVKVTRVIAINFNVDLIYDDDAKTVKSDGTAGGPKLQIKELMGIGLAYSFKN